MFIEDSDIEGKREMRRELNQILAALGEARIEGHFKRFLGVGSEIAADTAL
jgi:hypothetical protein